MRTMYTFNMILRNHYTHVYMYCIERSVYISIRRITKVNNICFVRLMVTMVAEFCSLVILIHNTLLGEIMISSTKTTRVNILYLYSPVRNDTFPHAKIQLH